MKLDRRDDDIHFPNDRDELKNMNFGVPGDFHLKKFNIGIDKPFQFNLQPMSTISTISRWTDTHLDGERFPRVDRLVPILPVDNGIEKLTPVQLHDMHYFFHFHSDDPVALFEVIWSEISRKQTQGQAKCREDLQTAFMCQGKLIKGSTAATFIEFWVTLLGKYYGYCSIGMDDTSDCKDALQRIKGSFYQLVYSFSVSVMVDLHFLSPLDVEEGILAWQKRNSLNVGDDESIGFHEFMITYQWTKIHDTFDSCKMRSLFHLVQNFPNNSAGKDKTTQTGAHAFVLDRIRACYQYSCHLSKGNDIDLLSDLPLKDITDYEDSFPLPKNHIALYASRNNDTYIESDQDFEFNGDYDDDKKVHASKNKGLKKTIKAPSVQEQVDIPDGSDSDEDAPIVAKVKAAKAEGRKKTIKAPAVQEKVDIPNDSDSDDDVPPRNNNKYGSTSSDDDPVDKIAQKEVKLRKLKHGQVELTRCLFIPLPNVSVDKKHIKEFSNNYKKAMKSPEIGAVLITQKKAVIQVVNESIVRNECRPYLDYIGKPSRKSGACKSDKSFEGLEVAQGCAFKYDIRSPTYLNDCYKVAYHVYPPMLNDYDTASVTHAFMMFIDMPMYSCMYCHRHPTGCGRSLNKGDVIKVDGGLAAELVKGKCWFFKAVRLNDKECNKNSPCCVGIVKAFATQAHLVANRIGVVTKIILKKETSVPTVNLPIICKHANVQFVDVDHVQGSLTNCEGVTRL